MERYRDDWHVGRASERDIFNALSARTGLDVSVIDRHAVECCRSIRFHPFTWRIATERRLQQALVTVNPDLFVERVAPFYELERHFDAVVVSCIEGTQDKVKLCEVALDRLGFDGPRWAALLIDNRQDVTDAWRRSGGSAHWDRGEAAFAADVPVLLG